MLAGLLVLLAGGCGSSSTAANRKSGTGKSSTSRAATAPAAKGSIGPYGIPLENGPQLARASSTAPGIAVDGIRCARAEQVAYHIHAHLQVYIDGQPRSLPGGIGMLGTISEPTKYGLVYGATRCYYWLHTHASDGVIHIESPVLRLYTLGEFFDEWGQPLTSTDVAGATGKVTAFINGQRWTKSPRALPLLPHAAIQLDVGSPVVAFGPVSWAGTKL